MSESDAWTDSLARDIEVTEGQIALAVLLPAHATVYVNVEVERLRRLVEAAKLTTDSNSKEQE